MPEQRQPAEAADDRDVESEIVQPAVVEDLIQPDILLEDAHDQRDWRHPAVPDAPEEPGRPLGGVGAVPGNAAGQGGQADKK